MSWREQQEFGKILQVLLDNTLLDEETINVVCRPKYFGKYRVRIDFTHNFYVNLPMLSDRVGPHLSRITSAGDRSFVYTNSSEMLVELAQVINQNVHINSVSITASSHADHALPPRPKPPKLWFYKYPIRLLVHLMPDELLEMAQHHEIRFVHAYGRLCVVYCSEDFFVNLRMNRVHITRAEARTPSGDIEEIKL